MSGDDERPRVGLRRPDEPRASASLSMPLPDSGVHPVVDLGAAPTLVSTSSGDGDEDLDDEAGEASPDEQDPPEGYGSRYADLGLKLALANRMDHVCAAIAPSDSRER